MQPTPVVRIGPIEYVQQHSLLKLFYPRQRSTIKSPERNSNSGRILNIAQIRAVKMILHNTFSFLLDLNYCIVHLVPKHANMYRPLDQLRYVSFK